MFIAVLPFTAISTTPKFHYPPVVPVVRPYWTQGVTCHLPSIYIYIFLGESVHNMHGARWSRKKNDADDRRTKQHSSSGHFERKQRTRLMAVGAIGIFRACCSPGAGSGGSRRAFCGYGADLSGTRRAFCGSGANSSGPFRVFCGSGEASNGYFGPAAASGQARPAISSQFRLWARLEVGIFGRCGAFEQPARASSAGEAGERILTERKLGIY